MFNNFSFILTALAYFALLFFNLQRFNASGESMMGSGLIVFGLLASYTIFSLFLTISVVNNGGFNWISKTVLNRNIGVGILWLGMVIGVVFCTMIRMEFNAEQASTGILHYLTIPIYFGATWLPLLMLAPYAILLNPEWRESISPNLYRVPLIVACVSGFIIYSLPSIIANINSSKNSISSSGKDPDFDRSMGIINREQSLAGLLDFTNANVDVRLQEAAYSKINQFTDLESEIKKALDESDFIDSDDQVFYFLERNNKLTHPELLVTPINDAILRVGSKIQNTMQDSDINKDYLQNYDIKRMCRVLDKQFNDSSVVFRPNMNKLLEILEMEIPKPIIGNEQILNGTLQELKLPIKNWLDSH